MLVLDLYHFSYTDAISSYIYMLTKDILQDDNLSMSPHCKKH